MSLLILGLGVALALGLIGFAGLVVLPRDGQVLSYNRNTVAAVLFATAVAILFVTMLGPLFHTFSGGFPKFADSVLVKYPRALLHLLTGG
jgi:thiol:disulfide interchange protein